jgi:hypothetical protein
LSQHFERIREHYCDAFKRGVTDRVRDPSAWLVEHTFGPPQEDGEAGPSLPMRHDLISLVEGQIAGVLVIRPKTASVFERFMDEGNGLQLLVSPFTWDQCLLLVQDLDQEAGEQPLLDWFDRWFNPEALKPPGESGIRGVIHSMLLSASDEPGTTVLEIDFGTAPVAALTELFDVLRDAGATSIVLCAPPDEDEAGQGP